MGFEPLTFGTSAWHPTAEVGNNLGGRWDRGANRLPMTDDPIKQKGHLGRGIEPVPRGSVLRPGDPWKSSSYEITTTPRIPMHNLNALDEHITDQVTKCP